MRNGNYAPYSNLQILTEEKIHKMSDGSLKLYLKRVKSYRGWCHYRFSGPTYQIRHPEGVTAIKVADYLYNTVRREKRARDKCLGCG